MEHAIIKSSIQAAADKQEDQLVPHDQEDWLSFSDIVQEFRLVCKKEKVPSQIEHRCYQILLMMTAETEKDFTWWEKIRRIPYYLKRLPKVQSLDGNNESQSSSMSSSSNNNPRFVRKSSPNKFIGLTDDGRHIPIAKRTVSGTSSQVLREGEELSVLLNSSNTKQNTLGNSSVIGSGSAIMSSTQRMMKDTPNLRPRHISFQSPLTNRFNSQRDIKSQSRIQPQLQSETQLHSQPQSLANRQSPSEKGGDKYIFSELYKGAMIAHSPPHTTEMNTTIDTSMENTRALDKSGLELSYSPIPVFAQTVTDLASTTSSTSSGITGVGTTLMFSSPPPPSKSPMKMNESLHHLDGE
jgi:hypothetical protein